MEKVSLPKNSTPKTLLLPQMYQNNNHLWNLNNSNTCKVAPTQNVTSPKFLLTRPAIPRSASYHQANQSDNTFS